MRVTHNFGDKIKILQYGFVQNKNSQPKDVHSTYNIRKSNEQEIFCITIIQNNKKYALQIIFLTT